MLQLLLVLGLAAGDPVSEAGTAYRQAREALEQEKYEEAVQLLRGAIQKVGEESDQLKYRDDVSRRRHSYFPYFEMGRARMLQAEREQNVYTQRDLLADAIGRLGQSRHPEAATRLDEAKAKMTVVQEAIALDGSFAAVKTRIEVLGNGERFTEAFKQLEAALLKFKGRGKELDEVRAVLKEKQLAALKRYEQLAVQRLSDMVLMDPVTAGDSISPLLAPVLVPPEVVEQGGPLFDWVRAFMAQWEKQMDGVRKAAELPGAQVLASADALDATGIEALSVNLPAGFRAARHLAQTARMGKLREIATGSEDVLDTKTTDAVVRSAQESALKAGEALGRVAGKDAQDRLQADVSAQETAVKELGKKIAAAAKERERLTAPIVRAEASLADGDTVGDTAALGKLKNDLFELESEATFGSLTARLRARALFSHAMTEAMLAFLEGKTPAEAVERCRVPAWRAYGFDPKVDARWSTRVSPKLQKVFEQIKPQ